MDKFNQGNYTLKTEGGIDAKGQRIMSYTEKLSFCVLWERLEIPKNFKDLKRKWILKEK